MARNLRMASRPSGLAILGIVTIPFVMATTVPSRPVVVLPRIVLSDP
jgi:hypothetical protein